MKQWNDDDEAMVRKMLKEELSCSFFNIIRPPRFQLSVILQYILFLTVIIFVLNNTSTLPPPPPPTIDFYCEKEFGYSNVSLDEILSGKANSLNINNFKYIYNANKTCKRFSTTILLILVKSAAGNFRKRRFIRETWGKDAKKRGFRVSFLLGYSDSDKVFVDYEHEFHKDIIQQNFQESYANNTYKIMMAFDWILNYCKLARYILIVDDDMYVNILNTINFILQADVEKNKYLYSGYLIPKPLPDRVFESKHYISEEEYPFLCYPPYIAGASIFLNQYTVENFFNVMPYIPYIQFDDVFIGFLAQKLHINPSSSNALIKLGDNSFQDNKANEISCIISQHGYEVGYKFRIAYNTTHTHVKTLKLFERDNNDGYLRI
ncbi:beta-1,3-galactosyltransferase 5-like [Saccostrea echinata]|uniref:beta-1,3-galactosyltransferase 5-like n=1 Tax=Saccostrea echinata TaxID=191078 RepID=UPI002A7F8A26|nr:beta-1,3-galactosyltransferase 5-like [Saccostrea echinata]